MEIYIENLIEEGLTIVDENGLIFNDEDSNFLEKENEEIKEDIIERILDSGFSYSDEEFNKIFQVECKKFGIIV